MAVPARDPLFSSLDPLVRDGSLTPDQANEVYRAVSAGLPGQGPTGSLAEDPHRTSRPVRALVAACVFGALLAGAGFVLASSVAERRTDAEGFDGKSFLVMCVVTVLFAGLTALVWRRGVSDWRGRALVGFLGALTLVTFAASVQVPWDQAALVYLAGALLLVGGLAGYRLVRNSLLPAAAFLGGLVLLLQIFSDTVDAEGDDTGFLLTVAMVLLAYGIVVTAAGWRFPCRDVTAMLGGIVALAGMYAVIVVNGFSLLLASSLGDLGGGPLPRVADMRTDSRIALFTGLLVGLALVAVYVFTAFVGHLVLAFLGTVLLPVITVSLLGSEHPVRWAGGFVAVGAAVLGAAVLAGVVRGAPGPGGPGPGGTVPGGRGAGRAVPASTRPGSASPGEAAGPGRH